MLVGGLHDFFVAWLVGCLLAWLVDWLIVWLVISSLLLVG